MAKRNMSQNSLKNLEKGKKICEETARIYQEKSSITQRENTQIRKEIETFCISSNKALAPIQASSLKELAKKADDILHNPVSTTHEIKLAMDILTFLRDSSGQKPTEKIDTTIKTYSLFEEETERKANELIQRTKKADKK